MAQITTPSGITLEYDTFGDPKHPALLLVSGFTAQMIGYAEGFCQKLADGGRYVIRYDNRDCGLSTKLDGVAVDMAALTAAVVAGDKATARSVVPYTLSHMAADGMDLLSALGIERAHVAGSSMGGMIVQVMAIEHPERVITMTSIMSTTGEHEYGQSTPEARAELMAAPPTEREEYINAAGKRTLWMSKRYTQPAVLRAQAAAAYDRSFYPEGAGRQMAAIMATGSRADALRALTVPTLVIHGLDDTLIAPSGGRRTAELVPGATLLEVPDMGHDRPEPLWPEITGAMLAHTALTATA